MAVFSWMYIAISEICDRLCYLAEITDQIDSAATAKYKLAQINAE